MTEDDRGEMARERNRRYRETYPEKVRESSRRYQATHRAEIAERDWARRQLIPEVSERRREASRRYAAAHPEKVRESEARYRESHPERRRETAKRYYATHREECLDRSRQYRARKASATTGARVSTREVFDRCGGRCHICGGRVRWDRPHSDPLSKEIDHLVPLSRGGTHDPANVALAHRRCNESRGAGRKPAQLWLIAS